MSVPPYNTGAPPVGGEGVVGVDVAVDTLPTPRRGRRGGFGWYIGRRVASGLLTLVIVSFAIFVATNVLPGSVGDAVLGKNATPQRVAALEERLGLDQPLLSRYWSWASDFVQGDMGDSAVEVAQNSEDPSISTLIGEPLRNSFVLAVIAGLLLLPLAVVVGAVAALRQGKAADYSLSYGGLILGSVPEFVLGSFLILIFFSELNLLPPVALVPPGASPLAHPDALVLPVLTLLGVTVAFCARQVRAGAVEVMRQEYVVNARLSGIPERKVLWRYVLRNSLAPSIQSYAQTLQYLIGGIVVVEALFAYPGVGQQLVNAVQNRDATVVEAIAIILAAVYIVINIVADVVVVLLVPKLRTSVA